MSSPESEPEAYLAVLKASYDYEPQSDDEIAIVENQLLLLVERIDDDWWKVKVKGESQDDDAGPVGLVPAAYVEQAEHTSLVKVLYDYDAAAPGELSVKEDDILRVFETEGAWVLAQSHASDGAGYVPGNYVEATSEEDPQPASRFKIVVPESAPRPVSTYIDPAVRVASHKITADDIKTWSVSEIDKKGKKKKGTLGIGNGSLFFASESDKAAVQKWQTADVTDVFIDKPKHIRITIGGPTPATMHFHTGSKENGDEIFAKVQSSKVLSSGLPEDESSQTRSLPVASSPPKDTKKATVHFSPASPVIIPTRPHIAEEEHGDEDEDEDEPEERGHDEGDVDETAIVQFDFTADGEDELSVSEGQRLVVLERDSDEWWKCRDAKGVEGVVPASYLKLVLGDAPQPVDAAAEEEEAAAEEARQELAKVEAKRVEQERREREEREKLARKKQEAQQKAQAAAAAADDARRKRQAANKPASPPPKAQPPPEPRQTAENGAAPSTSRQSTELSRPPADKVRVWHDRSGQFRVEAAFLGFSNGKLRLHKTNGVTVEVPADKMSLEDMRHVERLMAKKQRGSNGAILSDDDMPLAISKVVKAPSQNKSLPPQKKTPKIDWFDFFLSAGCDVDDCTRYAAAFERDKIDETLLTDITNETMRLLGLREGDILRVKKAIESRRPTDNLVKPSPYIQDQIRRDEELARQLQAQESGGRGGPAPNLFSGPGGVLKNPRRGRPQPTKSIPLSNVDIKALSNASEVIQRTSSPQASTPSSAQASASVQPPPRSSSALAPPTSGFDDNAWENRPSSTKPLVGTPPSATPRAPSAPPASVPKEPTPVAPTPTSTAPPAVSTSTSTNRGTPSLANTTESDIFEQLARLSELRKASSPAQPPQQPMQQPVQQVQTQQLSPSPSVIQTPTGFAMGMGMGTSPVPLGALQAQTLSPAPSQFNNGPRGPYAPVPNNQSLLQPLIPTHTGFNTFVPTRAPTFQNQPPLPQSNLLQPNMNTFTPSPSNVSPTMMLPQQTGMPFNNGFGGQMPFQNNPGFAQIQPQQTGLPSMMNSNFNGLAAVPPVPALPTTAAKDTSPANIFAQMKSGTFENDNNSAPRTADVYDPFRPNPQLQAQPTGWVGQGYSQYGMGYQR